jgi:hypothetical protein
MGAVHTKCPVTGQAIETGIETDEVSFRRFPHFVGHIFCPHCKSEHEWTRDTAWVVEESGKSSA